MEGILQGRFIPQMLCTQFDTNYTTGMYNVTWPVLMGGCELNRKTDEWLKQAGEWERIELEGRKGATGYEVIPDVMGRLVKAG